MSSDELRERREALYAERQILESLLEHPGWRLLKAEAESGIRTRRTMHWNHELASTDDALVLEKLRGEAVGMQTVLGLADVMILFRQEEIDAVLAEERSQDNA